MAFWDPQLFETETLQEAYDLGGGSIALSAAGGALALADAASTIGTMFKGTDSAGTTTYWAMGSNGIRVTGGSASVPGYGFQVSPADVDNGLYYISTNIWGGTAGGIATFTVDGSNPVGDGFGYFNPVTNRGSRLGTHPGIGSALQPKQTWLSIAAGSFNGISTDATSGATVKNSGAFGYYYSWWDPSLNGGAGGAAYRLAAQLSIVTNTTALGDWNFNFFNNVSGTNSVSINGSTNILTLTSGQNITGGVLQLPAGSASAPCIRGPQSNTGIYFNEGASDRIVYSIAGAISQIFSANFVDTFIGGSGVFEVNSSGVIPFGDGTKALGGSSNQWSTIYGVNTTLTGLLTVPAGSSSAPTIKVSTDADTGHYFDEGATKRLAGAIDGSIAYVGAAGFWDFYTSGSPRLQINGSGVLIRVNGSAGSPSIANVTNTTDGLYWTPASNLIGISIGGTAQLTIDGSVMSMTGIPKWATAGNVVTTVGSAGSASALPGDASGLIKPDKYLKVKGSDGTTYHIPAFAAA